MFRKFNLFQFLGLTPIYHVTVKFCFSCFAIVFLLSIMGFVVLFIIAASTRVNHSNAKSVHIALFLEFHGICRYYMQLVY